MITIYTLTYNEEFIIQFMIDHYRSRFPECHIVIYDNSSTDKTVEIAQKNNCEVRWYNSNNSLDDMLHAQIKNNCWKDAKTDWVLVCDLDELLDMTSENLQLEESLATTIIKPEGYDMTNIEDNYDIHNMKHGYRDVHYDKTCLFNKKFINEINFNCGAHFSAPVGIVKYNRNVYKLFHYKFIHPDYVIGKHKATSTRLSEVNLKHSMGTYVLDPEEKTRKIFQERRLKAIKVR